MLTLPHSKFTLQTKAPLVGKQPVVTTVYYEKPDEDNGKELVLWKPMLNFKPREDSLYMAARGVQTTHGE